LPTRKSQSVIVVGGGAFGLDVLFCVSADASHPFQKKEINFVGFCSPFIQKGICKGGGDILS
jgi:hypothetical protein